jgi:hypothetical protein
MDQSSTSSLPSRSTLVDAIRSIAADPDESVTFERVVAVALQAITGSDFGGVSELTKRAIRTRAASDPQVQLLDRAQYDTGEGPTAWCALSRGMTRR